MYVSLSLYIYTYIYIHPYVYIICVGAKPEIANVDGGRRTGKVTEIAINIIDCILLQRQVDHQQIQIATASLC